MDKTSLSVLALQEELSSSQTCTSNGSVYKSSTTQICQQASGFKIKLYLETLAVLVLNLVWRNKIYWVALKMLCHKFLCLLYCRINLYLPKLRCTNKVKNKNCLCSACGLSHGQMQFVNNSSKPVYLKQFAYTLCIKSDFFKQFFYSCLYIERGPEPFFLCLICCRVIT